MIENIKRFNIRIYGILINEHHHVLVSDEMIQGKPYTKFPGGGLEFGEGTKSCLIREFMEETGVSITVKEHLYTTDVFIPSMFDNDSQVMCIYYLVQSQDWSKIKTSSLKFDFSNGNNENFRWVKMDAVKHEEHMFLPTDRTAVQILNEIKILL
jgi:8-oxo-dGTP pyrophosphatase MutT (NUDIX family)